MGLYFLVRIRSPPHPPPGRPEKTPIPRVVDEPDRSISLIGHRLRTLPPDPLPGIEHDRKIRGKRTRLLAGLGHRVEGARSGSILTNLVRSVLKTPRRNHRLPIRILRTFHRPVPEALNYFEQCPVGHRPRLFPVHPDPESAFPPRAEGLD